MVYGILTHGNTSVIADSSLKTIPCWIPSEKHKVKTGEGICGIK